MATDIVSMIEDKVLPAIHTLISSEEIRSEPLWRATLQNKDFPEETVKVLHKPHTRSWLALKEWLKVNPKYFITDLYFSFRDNWVEIARNAEGYYFSHGLQAWYGSNSCQQLFYGGFLKNSIIYTTKYIVPELIENCRNQYPQDDISIADGLIICQK